MKWVDIGINLTNQRYDKDRDHVIANALAAGVERLIITGTNISESQHALALAESNPKNLFATAGCHPHEAKSLDQQGLAELAKLLEAKSVVAVGECGLDFNRNFSPPEQQIVAFKQQLELAIQCQKPLFLHERDAFDTQYEILKEFLPQIAGGVVHCFTGEQMHLEKYLELGLSIGITGWICDERRGQALFDMVKIIPDDRLLVETDGPYLTPRNLPAKPKNGRNEPKFLPHIGETIAAARGQSVAHIASISYLNSCRLFNLGEEKV